MYAYRVVDDDIENPYYILNFFYKVVSVFFYTLLNSHGGHHGALV